MGADAVKPGDGDERVVGERAGRSVRERLMGRGGGAGAAGRRGLVAGEGGKRVGRRGGRVGAVADHGERVAPEVGGGAVGPGGTAWQDLLVGLRYIRRHRVLAPLMLAIALGDLGFVGAAQRRA